MFKHFLWHVSGFAVSKDSLGSHPFANDFPIRLMKKSIKTFRKSGTGTHWVNPYP